MTIQPLDPGARSDGVLDPSSTLVEPAERPEPTAARVQVAQPAARVRSIAKPVKVPKAAQASKGTRVAGGGWHYDPEISWYGYGLYGRRTACGHTLTKSLRGVAHRSLPCGTKVTFRHKGRTLTVPVVDRGPYVAGRTWDLTGGACLALNHCFTGPIEWKLGG